MSLFDFHDEGTIGKGFLLSFGVSVLITVGLAIGMSLAQSSAGVVQAIGVLLNWAVGGIAVVQLAYVIPMHRHFSKTGEKATAKGVVIGAALTALLNCTCWVIVWQI